jgi:anti-sigma B factor antagonist
MSFETRTQRAPGGTVVAFTGELDIASEAEAAAALEAALEGGGTLVADLRGLEFLDSTGVRVLISADLHAREMGVCFGVARGDGMVRRLLDVTRIDQRFPVLDDPMELVGSSGEAQ